MPISCGEGTSAIWISGPRGVRLGSYARARGGWTMLFAESYSDHATSRFPRLSKSAFAVVDVPAGGVRTTWREPIRVPSARKRRVHTSLALLRSAALPTAAISPFGLTAALCTVPVASIVNAGPRGCPLASYARAQLYGGSQVGHT